MASSIGSVFISPSDHGFQQAKQARRGTISLDPAFDGFVLEFVQRYDVEPLWLLCESVRLRSELFPRLTVVLERTAQCRRFRHVDRTQQRAVAELFAAALAWPAPEAEPDPGRRHLDPASAADPRRLFRMPRDTPPSYPFTQELSVTFADFEAVARKEAHGLTTDEELDGFAASLGLGDQLWCVRRTFGPPVVFVGTEVQAHDVRASDRPDRWAEDYFALVRTHDEFGYLTSDDITIVVDSKERFRRHHHSWGNYVR